MKRDYWILYALACLLTLCHCSSPQKAIENKNYNKAMNLATKFIEKGKDLEANTMYLQTAAEAFAKEALVSYHEQKSTTMMDWKQSQAKLYQVLNQLGKRNINTNGLISESYDLVCEAKQEIDLKIINHYYDEGERLLAKSKSLDESEWARNAYQKFIASEREGAALFYDNLDELKADCVEYGSITVDSRGVGYNNIFLKPVADSTDEVADCTVGWSAGLVDFNSTSSLNVIEQKRQLIIGQNSSTDTSGIVTFQDITEEVIGFKNETTFNYTVSQVLSIQVTANTSECFLNSSTVTLSESNSCTAVEYTGDLRAFVTTFNTTCDEFFKKTELENKLRTTLNNNLFVQ